MRDEFNDMTNKHIKRAPVIHDNFHGTTTLRWKAGNVYDMDVNEKFQPKPRYERGVRKAMEKFK